MPGYQLRRSFFYSLWKHMSWSLDAAHIKSVPITEHYLCNSLGFNIQKHYLVTFFSHHYFHGHFWFSVLILFHFFFYTLLLTCIRLEFDKLQLFTKIILCFISSDKIHFVSFFVKHKAFLSWGYVWTIFQIMKSTIWKNYMIYIETINCRSNDTV